MVLVAQDFLHGLCFFLACLTLVFSSFCIHKPSSATTKLAKKRSTWFCLRCAALFLSFKLFLLFRLSLPGARSPGCSSQPLFSFGVSTPVFSSFWIRKPSSATRTAKNKHLGKAPKTNQMILRMFGRRTFFRGFGFCVCCMFLLFLDPEAFISYWD